MTGLAPQLDPVRHGGAGLRSFLNIAELWKLSRDEQMRILDVQDPAEFEDWSANVRAHEPIEIPMEVIVRIGCVLSIYASLETLLPGERAAEWLRAPNTAALFGGREALAVMTSGALQDLDSVARYLLGQIHG